MNIEVEKNRIFFNDGNNRQEIHPFWLRERVENKEFLDEITQQRLFDPSNLPVSYTHLTLPTKQPV